MIAVFINLWLTFGKQNKRLVYSYIQATWLHNISIQGIWGNVPRNLHALRGYLGVIAKSSLVAFRLMALWLYGLVALWPYNYISKNLLAFFSIQLRDQMQLYTKYWYEVKLTGVTSHPVCFHPACIQSSQLQALKLLFSQLRLKHAFIINQLFNVNAPLNLNYLAQKVPERG